MSAYNHNVFELWEFYEHCLDSDAVIVELEKRYQRVEQSHTRSGLNSCYVQREHELRAVALCDTFLLSICKLFRYFGTDHFGLQKHTEQCQTCVTAHGASR